MASLLSPGARAGSFVDQVRHLQSLERAIFGCSQLAEAVGLGMRSPAIGLIPRQRGTTCSSRRQRPRLEAVRDRGETVLGSLGTLACEAKATREGIARVG